MPRQPWRPSTNGQTLPLATLPLMTRTARLKQTRLWCATPSTRFSASNSNARFDGPLPARRPATSNGQGTVETAEPQVYEPLGFVLAPPLQVALKLACNGFTA